MADEQGVPPGDTVPLSSFLRRRSTDPWGRPVAKEVRSVLPRTGPERKALDVVAQSHSPTVPDSAVHSGPLFTDSR